MDSARLEPLLVKLRELFADEYQRGAHDALKRIVDVAQGTSKKRTAPSGATRRAPKQRAPRGAPRALIERVLGKEKQGASVSTVAAAATSPVERLVSGSAIRLELNRGKKEKRYRVSKGKWSLSRPRQNAFMRLSLARPNTLTSPATQPALMQDPAVASPAMGLTLPASSLSWCRTKVSCKRGGRETGRGEPIPSSRSP